MPFKKGNNRQSVFAPRAITLKTNQASGTITLPRQFREFSPILVTVPPWGTTGASVTNVRWLARTGPASAGNGPRIQLTLSAATDVLITQA